MMCNCIVDANAHVLQLVSASKDFVKSFAETVARGKTPFLFLG